MHHIQGELRFSPRLEGGGADCASRALQLIEAEALERAALDDDFLQHRAQRRSGCRARIPSIGAALALRPSPNVGLLAAIASSARRSTGSGSQTMRAPDDRHAVEAVADADDFLAERQRRRLRAVRHRWIVVNKTRPVGRRNPRSSSGPSSSTQ